MIFLQVLEQHTISIQFAVYISVLIVAVTTTVIFVRITTAQNTKDIAELKELTSKKADSKIMEEHVKSRDNQFDRINTAISKLQINESKLEQILFNLCTQIAEQGKDIKELLKK